MKYRYVIYLILLLIISCKKEVRNDKLEEKEILLNEDINRVIEESIIDQTDKVETFIDTDFLYPDLKVVQKYDSNLDKDTYDEQFIILTDNNGEVTLALADYYKTTKDYRVSWEDKLPVFYNSDFQIYEEDILGVSQLELVITGVTPDGNNALLIYQKSAAPKGTQMYYKNIITKISPGIIEIAKKSRDLDYEEKRRSQSKAYDVTIEKTDMINENTISITKETWVWDRRKRDFILGNSVNSEEKVNVREKLRSIYRGSSQNYFNFISGEWYLKSDDNFKSIIIIDPKKKQITLSHDEGVVIFNVEKIWIYRTRRYIKVTSHNSTVETQNETFTFSLTDTDEMNVILNNTPTRNGDYIRLNRENKKSLITKSNTSIDMESPFTGVFKNVAYSINFSYPEYKKVNSIDGILEEGIYKIISLTNGKVLLQMKSKENIVTNYSLNYTEQNLENQIIRTIILQEGVLNTYGIEPKSDKDSMKFEQTEVLNNE